VAIGGGSIYESMWGGWFKFVRFGMGDRSKIRFWHYVWCGDQTLKEAFSVSFNIVRFKEALVAEHMLFPNNTC
jgi:hypothetical protein